MPHVPANATTSPTTAPGVAWQQTVLMRNAQGQEEAFSIGPDGRVWSFVAHSGKQPLDDLELDADFLTVGRNGTGALVVIAAKGLRTVYRSEILPEGGSTACERWTPPRAIHLPTIQGATGVRRLYTQSDFSGMRIALIVDTHTAEQGASYVMACSQWHDNGPGPFILLPPLGAHSPAPAGKSSGLGGLKMFRTAHSG